jgi:hypothetical protein
MEHRDEPAEAAPVASRAGGDSDRDEMGERRWKTNMTCGPSRSVRVDLFYLRFFSLTRCRVLNRPGFDSSECQL